MQFTESEVFETIGRLFMENRKLSDILVQQANSLAQRVEDTNDDSDSTTEDRG